jgi:DNA-binding MarR family transcriptional regulator/GNAT superfamily N-acetyltransferase
MNVVAEVRQFNRFYTNLIGLLDKHMPGSDQTLQEGRVIYELATGDKQTAAELARKLVIDKAQLSRVIGKLRNRRLVKSEVDPAHAKKRLLSLTPTGRAKFAELDRGTQVRLESLLRPMGVPERKKMVASMRNLQAVFREETQVAKPITLRSLAPGDIGWVIHRQAVLYTQEYGWDWTYEGLIAKILGEFCSTFDATKEDGWVAECGGQIIGSIFLMKANAPDTAKLRLLYVEPAARGQGVGRRLVDTCIVRARQLGYGKLTLWTNDVLASARRIYQACGFRLIEENHHHSFGKDLTGQTWELEL